tara:strand:+ start:318 stop:566 length:249 start_codon:yes stop_codon:yes gene_type:complete
MKERKHIIKNFIEETFLVTFGDDLEGDTNLFESSIVDSYGMVQLITFLESEFSIKLNDEELMSDDLTTFERISKMVERKLSK